MFIMYLFAYLSVFNDGLFVQIRDVQIHFKIIILIVLPHLQWDLVCDRAVLKPSVHGIFAVGKFFGALFFGCVADK